MPNTALIFPTQIFFQRLIDSHSWIAFSKYMCNKGVYFMFSCTATKKADDTDTHGTWDSERDAGVPDLGQLKHFLSQKRKQQSVNQHY